MVRMEFGMKCAFMYAGQGSQRPGMGLDLYEQFPAFAGIIDRAETVHPGLKDLMFYDDGERLSRTENTQPALAAFAAGVTAVLYDAGIRPDSWKALKFRLSLILLLYHIADRMWVFVMRKGPHFCDPLSSV